MGRRPGGVHHLRQPVQDLAGVMAALVAGIEEGLGAVLRLDRRLHRGGAVEQPVRGFRGLAAVVTGVQSVVRMHPCAVLMSGGGTAVRLLALGVAVLEHLMMMMMVVTVVGVRPVVGAATAARRVRRLLALRSLAVEIVFGAARQRRGLTVAPVCVAIGLPARGGHQVFLLDLEAGEVQSVVLLILRPVSLLLVLVFRAPLDEALLTVRSGIILIAQSVVHRMSLTLILLHVMMHRSLGGEAVGVLLGLETGELQPLVLRQAQVAAAGVLAEELIPIGLVLALLLHLVLDGAAAEVEQGRRRTGRVLRIRRKVRPQWLIQLEDLLRLEEIAREGRKVAVGRLLASLIRQAVTDGVVLLLRHVLQPVRSVRGWQLLGIHRRLVMMRLRIGRHVGLQRAHALEGRAGARVACNGIQRKDLPILLQLCRTFEQRPSRKSNSPEFNYGSLSG